MQGINQGNHSMPNMRASTASEADIRRLRSLSLSQIRKHAEFAEYNHKPTPFNIRWIYGYNPKVGVINLNDKGSTTIFYAASNCAVLYNWTTNQMRILQGHRHVVSCIASDRQGKWLVTADSGPENIVIIWDSSNNFPQRTLFSPHRDIKVSRVALSADAKYLLTLGYKEKAVLFWWIWSFGEDKPHAVLEVNFRDSVVAMDFNPYNSEQFLLMSKRDIFIGVSGKIFVMERGERKETDKYELKVRKLETTISPDFGKLTCFTFVQDTAQILVATSRGAVLVFGYTIQYQQKIQPTSFENLRFVKVFRIEKYKINVITSIDGVITTGNNGGEIHFYDEQMKLLYWIHGFQVDNVRHISFNISPRSYQIFDPECNKPCLCWEKVVPEIDPETGHLKQKLLKQQLPSDASVGGKPIIVRDFIVCTLNQGVGFVDFVTEKLVTVLDNRVAHALSISVHPEKPFVCVGYADGIVELFDFLQHKSFSRLDLRAHYKVVIPPKCDSIKYNYEVTIPQLSVTCLKYSPSGFHLACGLNSGELLFLDPSTICILTETPFKDTRHAIKEITYSCDSLTLAFSDAGKTVGVYKYNCTTHKWNFIGKHRAHYKDITAILFLPYKTEKQEYQLVSFGADRTMVEYDIANSSDEYLEIFSLDRMDQTAVPLAGIAWPGLKNLDPAVHRTDMHLILVANDEYKYKIINCATTMTMSTVLGPWYEHPVRKMQLISKTEEGEELQYLLFATKNVIGLQKMPLDGNPWKHVGLLGHPIQIIEMCFREDSGTLFTIGAKDSCMCQWAANYRSVDSTTKLGGENLDPYYCLIENGRPGWLFQEIRDLFYYVQILCQGTFSPAMRRVKDYIPIDSLPDLMRALGYFPSEYEVENLIVEAKYKVYQRIPCTEIDFEEFVKLYLNHRPAFGYNYQQIRNAFRNFATLQKETYMMYRDDFIDMLGSYGECFSRELSWYLLSILSGQSFDDRATNAEDDFSFIPEEITFSHLATNIMGIQDADNLSEQFSAMESLGSQTMSSGESEEKIN
ncbi:cilia- and flagella-associated protein 251-like [Galleria mellonella]|uniref:Cilia- and flagella-associated protein 251 n=1 Tax=Galleria mellonella TaxID=7137 RepID=A0ABM3N5Z6_GALME|nr:cilia- and flagella-associated protein 251-like [Galleria mellonella]